MARAEVTEERSKEEERKGVNSRESREKPSGKSTHGRERCRTESGRSAHEHADTPAGGVVENEVYRRAGTRGFLGACPLLRNRTKSEKLGPPSNLKSVRGVTVLKSKLEEEAGQWGR